MRLGGLDLMKDLVVFQFTHPGKGATDKRRWELPPIKVSIHAPWEGCDYSLPMFRLALCSFNSRTLGRVRLLMCTGVWVYIRGFNSRTLGRVRLIFRVKT